MHAGADVPYPVFDRSKLRLKPLAERASEIDLASALGLDAAAPSFEHPDLDTLAERIVQARERERPVFLMLGAHVIRAGVTAHLVDLLERKMITHLAMNGGAAIHDFELALIGATTESVSRYLSSGEFGLWHETGQLNEIAKLAACQSIGFGEAIGKTIQAGGFVYPEASLLAAAYRLGVPATVHVGVGYDIVHEHPNCDGAALGAASFTDFLVFAEALRSLEGGVLLSAGSAVMAPEIFLKALAMARNVAHQSGQRIAKFTTAVFDLVDLGPEPSSEPRRTDPAYYFRPQKTLLVRSVRDGGEGFYIRGPHRATLPRLRAAILERSGK